VYIRALIIHILNAIRRLLILYPGARLCGAFPIGTATGERRMRVRLSQKPPVVFGGMYFLAADICLGLETR